MTLDPFIKVCMPAEHLTSAGNKYTFMAFLTLGTLWPA